MHRYKPPRATAALLVSALLMTPFMASSAAALDCNKVGVIGSMIMDQRQSGRPKYEVRSAIYSMDSAARSISLEMLDAAYSAPIDRTDEAKAETIRNFGRSSARGCERFLK